MHNVILAKGISKLNPIWIFGYPFVLPSNDVFLYEINTLKKIEVFGFTVCYSLGVNDKNGIELFTNDIINDFCGGDYIPDINHADYDITMAFPPLKLRPGSDTTRLGTIIREDGTIRIETANLGYAYNIISGDGGLSKTEVVGNQFDYLLKK